MRMSILAGGRQQCIFDQFCDSGLGAPIHLHAVEEVLEVIEGTAEIQLRKERAVVTANQSVLIPAGVKHGFRNLERATLRVRATLQRWMHLFLRRPMTPKGYRVTGRQIGP
jgi:mannose-6-phosphate isomerase-like protein (cupin superfamily)